MRTPSLAKVAYALACASGLTSAVPSGSRELSSQPAPFGAPAASAIFMVFFAPSSIEVTRSTKTVLIDSAVPRSRVTAEPYWLRNSLRTGVRSPAGANVLNVEAVGRGVVAQFREFFT